MSHDACRSRTRRTRPVQSDINISITTLLSFTNREDVYIWSSAIRRWFDRVRVYFRPRIFSLVHNDCSV